MTVVRRPLLLLTAVALATALVALPATAEPDDAELCVPAITTIDAATPVGFGSCPGVRPGAMIRIPRPDLGDDTHVACTLNFFFMGTDSRGGTHAYMGTAGHCILGEGGLSRDVGRKTWPLGQGPEVLDAQRNRIGELAYAVVEAGRDFALVRIDAGVAVSPQMCHFGGPTGINDDITTSARTIRHFGNGVGVGSVVPARTAWATAMTDEHRVRATGVAVPGDSGGPAITADGRALGVVVDLGLQGARIQGLGVDTGVVGITRLRPQLNEAARTLNQIIRIQTAQLR